jgi:hypothetical protein
VVEVLPFSNDPAVFRVEDDARSASALLDYSEEKARVAANWCRCDGHHAQAGGKPTLDRRFVPLVTRGRRDDGYGMNLSRIAVTAVAAVVLVCALPAVASAADYCVAPNLGCGPNNVQDFQDALDIAASTPEPDRVFLGVKEYVAPDAHGFEYTALSSSVEVIGSGRGQTVLTGPREARTWACSWPARREARFVT